MAIKRVAWFTLLSLNSNLFEYVYFRHYRKLISFYQLYCAGTGIPNI